MTNRFSILASLMVRARLDLSWTCLCVSRMLLLLAVIELITMPLTQYLWTWDNFLHGGLDCEMSLLIIVDGSLESIEWLLLSGGSGYANCFHHVVHGSSTD